MKAKATASRCIANALLLALVLGGASSLFSGCAGTAYRHDERADRRDDRQDYRDTRRDVRREDRVDRRVERWD